MKILYISNGSNSLGAGGMEYHLLDIINWLEKKGVETVLAVRKGTFFQQNLLRGRSNVYPLSWTGAGKLLSFFKLAKLIRDFSPDIISINREKDIVRVFYIVKFTSIFLNKKPKIVSVFHNLGWSSRFDLGKLDGIIFPNNNIKQEYIQRNRGAEVKSSIIYHGIHLPKVDSAEKLNPSRERKYFKWIGFPLIGMVGEMRKNQAELIDVACQLKKKIPDFTIALVGKGTEEQVKSLQEKINLCGLAKHFIFTGMIERRFMPDVFHDLDISVTTFRHDAFGMVYIESLSSYTPLVAYNSGGPVEILEKGGGILVNGGPEEMAEKIFDIVSDHELRKSLSITGRTVAEKFFSIETMGEQHYNFYLKTLEDKHNNNL
jgi:glycosyltransferase involved in cell wall biosynthesis